VRDGVGEKESGYTPPLATDTPTNANAIHPVTTFTDAAVELVRFPVLFSNAELFNGIKELLFNVKPGVSVALLPAAPSGPAPLLAPVAGPPGTDPDNPLAGIGPFAPVNVNRVLQLDTPVLSVYLKNQIGPAGPIFVGTVMDNFPAFGSTCGARVNGQV